MSNVYDTLIKGKTSYELDTLSGLVNSQGKWWEESPLFEKLDISKLDDVALRDFEFGSGFPEMMDQFQYETYLYHYKVYLEGKSLLKLPKYVAADKAHYLNELSKRNEKFMEHLAFLYLEDREWDKALDLFQQIVKNDQNVYLLIFMGLLARINRNLKQSMSYFLQANNQKIPDFLKPSCYMWMGEILSSLKFNVWAIGFYRDCIALVEDRAQNFHWFVPLAFLYAQLGYLVERTGSSRNNSINEMIKPFFIKSFLEYDKNYQTFIPTTKTTSDYQQVCVCIKLAHIYYHAKNYKDSIKDTQETRNINSVLLDTYRRLSMVYVYLKDTEAKKYLKMPKFTIDLSNLTIAEQYELRKKDAERLELEEKTLAPYATDQNHIVQYFCLCEIAVLENDKILFFELVELALRPSVTGFNEIPIQWYQKITSRLISYGEFKQAQMTMSKCMLAYREYSIGWYVLFLLSIINNDWNYLVGSYQKLLIWSEIASYWRNALKLSHKFEKLDLLRSKL